MKEPSATFSAGFGAPFLPRHPGEYARMLVERLELHDVPVWLVNTGWTGGPYGVGHRMDIEHTRNIVRAAIGGQLDRATYEDDPIFRVAVPTSVPGVPDELLQPRATWVDPDAYDATARRLAAMFAANFAEYADGVSEGVRGAGPIEVSSSNVGEIPRSSPGEG